MFCELRCACGVGGRGAGSGSRCDLQCIEESLTTNPRRGCTQLHKLVTCLSCARTQWVEEQWCTDMCVVSLLPAPAVQGCRRYTQTQPDGRKGGEQGRAVCTLGHASQTGLVPSQPCIRAGTAKLTAGCLVAVLVHGSSVCTIHSARVGLTRGLWAWGVGAGVFLSGPVCLQHLVGKLLNNTVSEAGPAAAPATAGCFVHGALS
jgi:hypothetical protein